MVDPVTVTTVWVANCDLCGWHCPASKPQEVVREWARIHRLTCPFRGQVAPDECSLAVGHIGNCNWCRSVRPTPSPEEPSR
jgi:hypothetical protein